MATSSAAGRSSSAVVWEGHPWVVPRLAGFTLVLLVIGVLLTWFEFRVGDALTHFFSIPLIGLTYGIIGVLWLIGALDLAILRASRKYTLRQSSMDIARGILSRKTFTLSAAGFSDLEVVQGIEGRLLDMGDIVMETDSRRDLRLKMIHDPMNVAAKIRSVMATPMVRLAPESVSPVVEKK
jgi:uncharacterized membrane protein YdbT with pleckstrin-like domain